MAAPPPPPKGGGMSLYANLLNPKADASATVTGAPVVYDNGEKEDAATKKEAIPALRFQPIRRPQVNQKKPAKPAFPKSIPAPAPTAPNDNATTTTTTTNIAESKDTTSNTPSPGASGPAPAPAQRSTLADWAATEEDEYIYGGAGEKRQRGGRRAKKKKSRQPDAQRGTDWDEIYDPSRPTNVEEYLRSDERVREVQEWKAVLYAHRRGRGRRGASYDSGEDSEGEERPAAMGNQFAPPGDYAFAPPPMSPQPQATTHPHPPPAAPAAPIPDDATGDDAFARRLAMSGMAAAAAAPPVPTKSTPNSPTPPLPPPPPEDPSGATIARAPVRYEAPPQPPAAEHDYDDDDGMDSMDIDPAADPPPALGLGAGSNDDGDGAGAPRTNRPGQKGFAQRLMSKYGWTAGSGLGADSSGIVNPLQVKVERRRKRPDAEGGGFAEPGGRARIIGGKTAATATAADKDRGKFGAMSEVLVLRGMLEGMENLQGEVEGGLGQEIGEECGDKYGRVERLYIDIPGRQVFIKFTDQVSALRAVNALEGRVFNGNAIAARFWDAEKFEKGLYS